MKKWIFRIFLLLFVLVLAGVLGVYFYLRSTLPVYEGELQLSGLQAKVKVVFDEYGVPHIYAGNEQDAYFALGYLHAQERLFQMEMLRRVAEGRLAEILGEELLDVDKKMRFLGMKAMGERNAALFLKHKDARYYPATMAYLDGINTFIKEGNFPVEFRMLGFEPQPFAVKDVFSITAYMAFGFTSALTEDPMATMIKESLGELYLQDFRWDTVYHHQQFHSDSVETDYFHHIAMAKKALDESLLIPFWEGSNSWAISGKKSKSGKVLLGNDTHIPYGQPAVWYEAYLEYPGFSMYGYYLGAVPHAIIGHNDDHAWTLTIFPVDQFDLYREKINPGNENQYWHFDHWQDFDRKQEVFHVKGEADVSVDVRYNQHGPVVDHIFSSTKNVPSGTALTLWWIVNHIDTRMMEALYGINHAKTMAAFEKSASLIDFLGLNVVYGDKEGNIAFWACGKIPKRPEQVNSLQIIDGSKRENELLGYYPFAKNPKIINPEKGYIVTANNFPSPVDSIVYPGYYAPGYRAQRIEDMIAPHNDWDVEAMKTVQLDVVSGRDVRLTRFLLSQTDEEDKRTFASQIAWLEAWDGNYGVHSKAATVYTRILYEILHATLTDELGEKEGEEFIRVFPVRQNLEKLLLNAASPWWDDVHTKAKESRRDILRKALHSAFEKNLAYYGGEAANWEWGKHHTLEHIHPIGRKKPFDKLFNVGPFAVSGGVEVVDKQRFSYNSTGEYKVTTGPSMRYLLDFAAPARTQGILPTGESGNFMSPHYDDQSEMFVHDQYRMHYMREKDMKKQEILMLLPAK